MIRSRRSPKNTFSIWKIVDRTADAMNESSGVLERERRSPCTREAAALVPRLRRFVQSLRLSRTSLCYSVVVLILSACAPKQQIVINQAFDFAKVRRISVVPLDGPGGPAATDALVKELVETGIEVTDAKHPGDIVLKGSVLEY